MVDPPARVTWPETVITSARDADAARTRPSCSRHDRSWWKGRTQTSWGSSMSSSESGDEGIGREFSPLVGVLNIFRQAGFHCLMQSIAEQNWPSKVLDICQAMT